MDSTKKTARRAGVLFLAWIVIGLYGLIYLPSRIMVAGDSVATASNLLAHEFLFQLGTVADLIGNTIWLLLALVFYQLFKSVDGFQSKLLILFVVVQIPVGFLLGAFNIASLMIVKSEVLASFEPAQRQDLAMLFLKFSDYAILTLEFFWGLWLLPLAILVYKSGFLPRFLGVWLSINGIAYVVLCMTSLLFPEFKNTVYQIAMPTFFGELAFMLWLLIMGAKEKPAPMPTSALQA